jgi:hypothetical protein
MDLPKSGIIDIYLLKPKWPGTNTGKAHLKKDCPQKDILMFEDHEGVRKNMEIVHLEKK